MSDKNTAIEVNNISKSFKLPHERRDSIKDMFVKGLRARKTYEKQEVLKKVSFNIKEGEFFGILGRNGSGKSTLLKIMAGIYSSDEGRVKINGKLTPFIELGVGFNPELTGRENVFLNGALLGFSRTEMEKKYKEIVEFAELEKFMDQKLKNYSSGMQVRLAFSIAIRANTNILLIDEVLAVGDANFQKKCFEVFKQMKREGKTVVFVSHDVGAVKEYCDKAILLDKGEIISQGDTTKVVGKYIQINRVLENQKLKKINEQSQKTAKHSGEGGIRIKKVWVTNKNDETTVVFKPKEKIVINCEIKALQAYKNPSIVLRCHNPGGPPVFSVNSSTKKIELDLKNKDKIKVRWELSNIFNDGVYYINAYVLQSDVVQDQILEAQKFEVEGWEDPYSIVHPDDNLSIVKNPE